MKASPGERVMCQGRLLTAVAFLLSLSVAAPVAAQKPSNKGQRRDRPVVLERRSQPERTGKPARVYQDPAFARGGADGHARGLDDGRDGDRYDPARHTAYRSGDAGYAASYGTKDGYKTNYRDGFRHGYEEGYRKGTRGER